MKRRPAPVPKPEDTEPQQFEFRVIAGSLKGKKIVTPNLGITRPPLSRLRKSIFDFLTPYLPESRYLDLYSGTGSYLFEAISRRADYALGVDLEPILVEAINTQAESFGVADRLRCLKASVLEIVPRLDADEKPFDIVMIAPPQWLGLMTKTLRLLAPTKLVTAETLVIGQHDTKETRKIDFGDWEIVQQRKYGNTTYSILRRPAQDG